MWNIYANTTFRAICVNIYNSYHSSHNAFIAGISPEKEIFMQKIARVRYTSQSN